MMRVRSLFRKLFLGTTLLIVVVLGICAWLIVMEVERFYAGELTAHLKSRTIVIRETLRGQFDRAHADKLDQFLKALAAEGNDGIRITIIQKDGTVLADSEGTPEVMDLHDRRKEVRQAMAKGWGEDTRYSKTLSRDMKYVATRVGPPETPWGVVRAAMAMRTIGERMEAIQHVIWTIALLGLLSAVIFALGLARLWSQPIRRITAMARSLARGDLSARFYTTARDEIAVLGQSLNEMRNHLASQLDAIDRQRRTLESLLIQLHEGVLVADPEGKVLLVNPSAMLLLGYNPQACQHPDALIGLPVEQCVQHHALQQLLLSQSKNTDQDERAPDVQEIRIQTEDENGERFLLARASDISLPDVDSHGSSSQADSSASTARMLVLADVTQLTRTDRIKASFAANASHELRTPLSVIRTAVETLMNMDMATDAQSAAHFLDVIDRHSDRMEQMVSDLLDLSRIEASPTQFKPQHVIFSEWVADLHTRYLDRMEAKNLQWMTDVPPDIRAIEANAHLLGIVLDNLIDNAIKFTDHAGEITLSCRRQPTDDSGKPTLAISVTDNGCGIPLEEQDRVFERFYQVEKARSGPDRGTGLGLSIVRHAVAAMHGTLDLQSKPGEGTRVTITIPQPA